VGLGLAQLGGKHKPSQPRRSLAGQGGNGRYRYNGRCEKAMESFLDAVCDRQTPRSAISQLCLESLLVELDLARYREAFEACNVTDASISQAAAADEAIDAMIAAVGLRGGSATKFKRRLRAARDTEQKPVPPSSDGDRPRKARARPSPAVTKAPAVLASRNGRFLLSSEQDLADAQAQSPSGVCVVEFTAAWCHSCKKFAPAFDKLVKEFAASTSFCEVDVDQAPELTSQYGASQLPLFCLFRNGVRIDQLVGGKQTALREKILAARCSAGGTR
jgi:thioredoxin 1